MPYLILLLIELAKIRKTNYQMPLSNKNKIVKCYQPDH